jgi:hypothetical protein
MNLGGDAFLPVEDRFCTPLKHLVLEECNITPSGLKNLMTLPKALEVLYLGRLKVISMHLYSTKLKT